MLFAGGGGVGGAVGVSRDSGRERVLMKSEGKNAMGRRMRRMMVSVLVEFRWRGWVSGIECGDGMRGS